MEKSKVYYTDFRAKLGEGLPLKLQRLIRTGTSLLCLGKWFYSHDCGLSDPHRRRPQGYR